MNQSSHLGWIAPSPRHGDDVVFKVFETLINAVHRWRFHHPTKPLRRIELRAIRRQGYHSHALGNALILLLHVEPGLIHDHHMERLRVTLGDLLQKHRVRVLVDGRREEQLHLVLAHFQGLVQVAPLVGRLVGGA